MFRGQYTPNTNFLFKSLIGNLLRRLLSFLPGVWPTLPDAARSMGGRGHIGRQAPLYKAAPRASLLGVRASLKFWFDRFVREPFNLRPQNHV
jgi:hypothetical protein